MVLPALLLAAAPAATVVALRVLTALPGTAYPLLAGAGLTVAVVAASLLLRSGIGALAYTVGLVTAFLLPLNNLRLSSWLTAADVSLMVAVGLGLLQSSNSRLPVRVPRTFVVGMIGLVVAGAVGSAASPEPVSGLINFVRFLLSAVASVILVFRWSPGTGEIRALFRAWLAGNAVNVAVALMTHPRIAGQRPAGLTTHPNALGLVCVLSLAIGIALHAMGGRRDRLLALVSVGLAAVGAVISGSRAALIGFFVVLLVRTVLGRSWRLLALIIGAAAMASVVWTKMSELFGETTALGRLFSPGTTVGDSDAFRLDHLRVARDSFLAHPVFGSGFANATDAHNVLLQVVVASGLLGLVGFLVACWPMLRGLWRPSTPSRRWLALLSVAFLADGMFSNNLWDRYIWLSLAIGIYASCARPVPETGVMVSHPVSLPAGAPGWQDGSHRSPALAPSSVDVRPKETV